MAGVVRGAETPATPVERCTARPASKSCLPRLDGLDPWVGLSREWFVDRRPTPFAGGENERRWKAALQDQSPSAVGIPTASNLQVRFILSAAQDGRPGSDLDNLLEPVLSVAVNKLGWAGGRRPNLTQISASKTFGECAGAYVRVGTTRVVWPPEPEERVLLDDVYRPSRGTRAVALARRCVSVPRGREVLEH